MASAWRVVAFFVVVFLVPALLITLPLYARYTLYPTRYLALSPSDTLDLHYMASTFWCQGQRLSGNGTFDAYLLDEAPKPDKRRVRVTQESPVLEISEELPSLRTLHLVKGSTFALDVCAKWDGGVIIVVRGEKNLKKCFYEEVKDWDDLLPDKTQHGKPAKVTPEQAVNGDDHVKVNPKFPPSDTSKAKPPVEPALPIGISDVVSDDDDEADAREIFDEEKLGGTLYDNDETWVLDHSGRKVEATTIRLLDVSPPYTFSTRRTTSVEKISSVRADEPEVASPSESSTTRQSTPVAQTDIRSSTVSVSFNSSNSEKHEQSMPLNISNKKVEEEEHIIDDFDDGDATVRLLRSVRAVTSSGEHSRTSDAIDELDEKAKLELLHSVVDTVDVTAGNSSHSSSEEFMAKCTDTIIYADIQRTFNCSSKDLSVNPKWRFKINSTDDYYFIFLSDNSIEMNLMKYYLQVSRVMYKVSDYEDFCNSTSECAFPLSFLGSEAVVIEMAEPDYSSSEEVFSSVKKFEVQAVCQPRVAVYLIFILMVPFIILLFAFQ
ncbi:uncharacterized protein LOC108667700 [Hyalella azteca]|uniref:Uncharacterized protein LOC108667700 n=1 Tax=Hyalella azteca TaxID=294128 RepID=A0A8B7N8K3_HYAAZ|nr:uncharacterized protein LOC108667700 [Hyalella azteca]